MRFGVLFLLLSSSIFWIATRNSGLWILYWPALSSLVVSVAYLRNSPRVLGKSQAGRIRALSKCVLFPYLVLLWGTWHLLRFCKSEPAWHTLTDTILIGRLLLPHEFPDVDHVIDLTCEFDWRPPLRRVNYLSRPILDGSVPTLDELSSWVDEASNLRGKIYIHCAEGHGRTGLFASALLIQMGVVTNAEEALATVCKARPLVRLNSAQTKYLQSFVERISVNSLG